MIFVVGTCSFYSITLKMFSFFLCLQPLKEIVLHDYGNLNIKKLI